MLVFKDRQKLHCHREEEETQCADHEGDAGLSKAGQVMTSIPPVHAGDRHVQSVGDKAQDRGQSSKVQKMRIRPDLLETQHGERNYEAHGQLSPKEIRLVGAFEDGCEHMTVNEILKP